MSDDIKKTYADGLLEGRVRGIEETVQRHDGRLDTHEKRLSAQERITYSLLGALFLLELLPTLKDLMIG